MPTSFAHEAKRDTDKRFYPFKSFVEVCIRNANEEFGLDWKERFEIFSIVTSDTHKTFFSFRYKREHTSRGGQAGQAVNKAAWRIAGKKESVSIFTNMPLCRPIEFFESIQSRDNASKKNQEK
jgi:hypothetical protein